MSKAYLPYYKGKKVDYVDLKKQLTNSSVKIQNM